MDQSKKTMRHFYCRDVLWETFEQMANDFDCSIDYLINEAMRYYARSKNYQAAAGAAANPPEALPGRPPSLPESSHPQIAVANPTPNLRRSSPPPPPPVMAGGDGAVTAPPARRPPSVPPASIPAARRTQPPMPRAGAVDSAAAVATLYLIFNNQRISIDKDQFIIGR